MSRRSGRVRRAVNASSSDILACLGKNDTMPFVKVAHNSELEAEEKEAIWNLYEENMFDLYTNSSFGWKPTKRKKEIFHNLSRFLLVYDSQEEAAKMIGFCMFRFENEEGECVVYCYDIQLSAQHHRRGFGKKIIEFLSTICKSFDMDKIVLTVLKANKKAMTFYQACSFTPDAASPSVYLPEDDPSREKYDYEIMSKAVRVA